MDTHMSPFHVHRPSQEFHFFFFDFPPFTPLTTLNPLPEAFFYQTATSVQELKQVPGPHSRL